jgi:hypothetical protein
MTPVYKQLAKVKHPEYDAVYWRKIRSLYAGMSQIRKDMGDNEFREVLFPKHMGEEDWVYAERCKRMLYDPYMGYLIDTIVAQLGNDPLRISEDTDESAAPSAQPKGKQRPNTKTGKTTPPPAPAALSGKTNGDPFYDAFFQNCAPRKAEKKSFNQLVREQIRTALLCQRAWTLVEMPPALNEPANRAREQAEVSDGTYACGVDPECVYDWETGEDGELTWALVCMVTARRPDITSERKLRREEYTVYTAEGWEKFVYEYDPEKNPPKDEQPPDSSDSGTHSFKRVPLLQFCLPEGLWAGAKIESLAAEHLNKLCALSWSQYRSLFQFLGIKLGAPDPLNPVTEDQNRAVNQPLGPGRVFVMGDKDDASYVGPDSAPFVVALDFLNHLRDEMHRVLSMMAMSVDNSGAALKRSADSKQVDQQQSATVLKDLGRRCREHGELIYETVSDGRGDDKAWVGQGMDQFDEVSMDSMVNEAALLETVPIPSPTFKALYKFELARRALPGATDDQLETIMDELQSNISAEDEMDQASKEVQSDRLEDGVLPGETPPPEDGAAPPKGKKPAAKGGKSAKKKEK